MAIIFAAWAGILLDAMGFRWGLAITAAAGACVLAETVRAKKWNR